jgi:Cu/Zn superoxide dismutase
MSFQEGLISILKCEHGKTHGVVFMSQLDNGILFQVFCKGLQSGKKRLQVHKRGNLMNFYESLDGYYNNESDKNEENKTQSGDIGDIMIDSSGNCEMSIINYKLTLDEIVGRSLIIHAYTESSMMNNYGKEVCYGIIGYQ